MHSNVWEWCLDGLRNYTSEPVIDLTGPVQTDPDFTPAVHGGCWLSNARWARSAYRDALHPDDARRYQGFRLCLSSI